MKFHFVTLGCPKNRVDSEVMFGSLLQNHYEYTEDPKEAELIVVNSCSFIEDAKKESIDTILEMSKFKTKGHLKKLVVAGCLAQRYQKDVESLFPEVDHFIGTGEYYKISSIVESESRGNYSIPSYIHSYEAPRMNSMPAYTAYLKLTEGCDRRCAFCIIPKIRGKQKSQSIENLVLETQALVRNGVTELNLIGQDLTSYGTDLRDQKTNLEALLTELVKIKEVKWIRLLYCYPDHISEDFLNLLRTEEKICKYIDMPLQHIDDEILKSMRRGVNSQKIRTVITRLRDSIPNLVFRTSFIAGYPGETQEQFEKLYEFVKKQAFDHVGVFTYSQEEDTHAATLPEQLTQKVKLKRKEKLMMLQSEISLKKHKAQVGHELEVLVEGWDEAKKLYQARSFGQAPDIDGNVFIEVSPEIKLKPGQYCKVKIKKALPYDLVAQVTH
ncbi:MAG: 30S ribosomal protein S12 methylthiotransferase RimO [Deltaproteobacteria bacterium]|nr:30S ribosomal protein S12 methylthiotransferase RimO [Deltaproteobacteria bacterium]MBI3017984.1 30S ribosomal protein S12 methylthiotransferase RimO [Deltaproteobacteria bacterium]